ncbi:RNA-binding S4 domain-containing protein [Streptomyces tauricus]|uniref:RNA-binding S4 domain-containing protein n=1 Tax=Streptomyces tauricus TaxID=68274 RepID=UPI0034278872
MASGTQRNEAGRRGDAGPSAADGTGNPARSGTGAGAATAASATDGTTGDATDGTTGDATGGATGDATGGATDAVAVAKAAAPASGETVRVDSWIWSVRLVKTRSMGATACRGGHVRVNGERVKPAYAVRVGDEVRLRHADRERIVIVKRVIRKRVGPPVAAECYVDNSPPPPPREAVAPAGIRDRGTGRPTKRDRRELERLRGLGSAE